MAKIIETKKNKLILPLRNKIVKEDVEIKFDGGLNIHYGQTAPEDTSKLWVKCDEPSKVEIANSISGGNETLDYNINSLSRITAAAGIGLVGNNIYIFGGYSGGNIISSYNIKTNSLNVLSATLPSDLYHTGSATVGKKIYLFGGQSGSSNLNTILVFDTETNSLENLTETQNIKLLTSSKNITAQAVGKKIYLFGEGTAIYVFDTETLTNPQKLSVTLPVGTGKPATSVVGTKIYLFGGYYNSSYLDAIQVFDTETNTTTKLSTTLPTKATYITAQAVGTKIYLFGGTTGSSSSNRLNTINVFDTETLTNPQTLATTLPVGIGQIASACVGKEIYLFGGNDTNNSSTNTISRFNVAFDVEQDKLFLLNQNITNKVSIIKTDNINVEIGVKMALLGDENNEGQNVPFAVHNGTEWVEF